MPRLLSPSRLTIAMVAVLALGGCAGDFQLADGARSPLGAQSEAGGAAPRERDSAGRVSPGLERFYSQNPTWDSCQEFAATDRGRERFADPKLQCTRVEVPLDYAQPQGRVARLGVLRRPADNQQERLGSLLVNPGGPGASGMDAVASLAGAVDSTELGRRFDLVGFDPRGIGASEPKIVCRNTQEQDAERLDLDLDTSPAGVAQTESEHRAYAALCAERSGKDVLANVGTRDVARDMDVLRSALGDNKLSYLGYSYGTRIGTAYAEQFPGNVRAMVLDGALDPDENLAESQVNQGAGFQKSFDAFVSWCLAQPQCWLGNTPKDQANRRFQELLRPLITAERPVGNRKFSYNDATIGTLQALYSDQFWSVLNRGLTALAKGDGSTLLILADLYYQRDQQGYSGSQDAFKAIRCLDDPPVTDPVVLREVDRRYRQVAPFLDDGNPPSAARDACVFWPVPPTYQPGQPQVDGLPTVLVISTTGDPATPYQAGVKLANQLRGMLLSFEGQQHTVALQGVKCVDETISEYLVLLTVPKRKTCVA
ncbi:MAG TPA: alpha/beta hydrolase [Pseudonocardiaceae bacterium]|jgi:pimeloyl-ACP methyl ester carboxylesterase|nr:alpha/beta hydrolase [Pseudonocardiaceae bacterium]